MLLDCPSGIQSSSWYFLVPAGMLAGSLCQQPRCWGEMHTLPVSDDFRLLNQCRSALIACGYEKKRCHIAEGLKKRKIFILSSRQC